MANVPFKRYAKRKLLLAIFAISVCFCGMNANAQRANEEPEKQKREFRRLTTIDEIGDGGLFIIGATARNGAAFTIATKTIKSKRIVGRVMTELKNNPPKALLLEDEALVYLIEKGKSQGTLRLKMPNGSKGISATDGKVDVVWDTRNVTDWKTGILDDGSFMLEHPSNGRVFAASDAASKTNWGNYTKGYANGGGRVYLYKLVELLSQKSGNALMPENGAEVVLLANDCLMTVGKDASVVSLAAENAMLRNGKIAPFAEMVSFEAGTNEAEGKISFKAKDGRYLQHDLSLSAVAATWKIENGHILSDGNNARLLCYDKTDGNFKLVAEDEATVGKFESLEICSVAENPNFNISDGKVMTLSGGWTSDGLAKIKLDGILSLDLTQISLPRKCRNFENQQDGSNSVLYVSESEADEGIFPKWNLLVLCSPQGNTMARQGMLHDKADFSPSKPFTVLEGQMQYVREMHADGNWETLCLPFETDLPPYIHAEALTGIEQNAVNATPVTNVGKGQAVIFRNTSGTNTTNTLSLTSLDGEISVMPQDLFFKGTYVLEIVDGVSAKYLLNAEGSAFVKAARESKIPPFRAYVQSEAGDLSAMKNILRKTSGIEIAETAKKENVPCYTVDGKRVSENHDKNVTGKPKGIYVRKGQVFINK